MGGSTERGNVTPYAEFNAWVDPEALALVVGSGVRFTMVGLNVTHRALVTAAVRERLAAVGTATAAFGDELLEFFCRTNDEVFGMPDGPLHDPVAVAVLADPDASSVVHTRLDVELAGTETVGATSVDSTGCCAASRTRGSRPASTSTGSGMPPRGPRSRASPEPGDRAARPTSRERLPRARTPPAPCDELVHAREDLLGPERVPLDLGLVADAGEHEHRVQARPRCPATMSVSMRSPIIAVFSECAPILLSAERNIIGFGLPTT